MTPGRALGLAALCAGCTAAGPSTGVPALRTSLEPASTSEIENVVSSALDGRTVSIADDALANTSLLTIERGRLRRVDAPVELGRDLGRPEVFQLVLDGNQCFLVHDRTELRWLLTDTDCARE